MVRPILGDVELQQVQKVEIDEDQVLAQHDVPALEGDFLQRLNRRATQVTLTGVLTGPEVGEGLKTLREKFRAAEPVPFVADITTATQVDQVLIEEMGVRELAGKPERFEYALTLREFIVPPEAITEEPPEPDVPEPPDDDIDQNVGTLIVEVIVEGQPNFDFSQVTVTVQGTTQDGEDLSRTLTTREGNIWTEEGIPASRGEYTVAAVVTGPPAMSGSARTAVRAGQKAGVKIILRTGVNIATAFIVHFWFDNAFIEPCMRSVMREVAAYAQSHPDEKLLIVGHTDKVGPPNYNQPLSERRARSAYAHLTYGRDPEAAAVEWDQLRRKRTTRRSINDTWGAREYQYILQDLGYYPHSITEEHDDETDAAVRRFQEDKGLAVDGKVGDHTWLALINAYLGQDSLAIPESQFLPNARDGCDGGILKWLGCGEEDPVDTRGTAWRPNRRTEFLFVKDDTLPCKVPEPKTFDLPPPDGAGPTWCLDGGGNGRCCFVTPAKENVCPQEGEKWCRQPVDPRKIRVSGSVKFEDGTPLANTEYILIAPDGKYLHKDAKGKPDLGEVPSGEKRGRPNPIHNRTDDEGLFSFPKETPVGVYVLELVGRFVARLEGEPPEAAKGNVVCKRLDGSSDFDVVVVSRQAMVSPIIILATPTVVVKKPYTSPARQPVTLRTDGPFFRSGTCTRSSDAIRFFTAASGGTEITFNGTDNVFTGTQLTAGVQLFAESARPSATLGDVQLMLTLTPGSTPVGPPATAPMTAVELTLDICLSRMAPGVDPVPLSTNDKINMGRFVQVRDPGNSHERAMLIVRPANPAAFTGDLVLIPINARVQAFRDEVPAPGQVPLLNPHVIPNSTIPVNGARFFAEGLTVSGAACDTGFRLGIRDVENDGDRVAITVIQIEIIAQATANAPAATFVRVGLWDHAFRADGTVFNDPAEANNFVGADTRRFYLRVRDAASSGRGHTNVDWRTVDQHDNNIDAPATRNITLVETAANPGVFISRALMLVTDRDDQNQRTHHGLPAGIPSGLPAGITEAGMGQSNHRIRLASQLGSVIAEYKPAGAILPVKEPVFRRTPHDEKRRVPLQIFVLRVAAGGAGVIPTAPGSLLWTRDLPVVEETYARLGIVVETVVAPGTTAGDIQEERPFVQNETVHTSGPHAFTLLRTPVVKDARNRVEVRPATGAVQVFTILYDDDPRNPGAGEVKLNRATGRLTFQPVQQPGTQDRIVASYVVVGHRAVLIDPPAGVNPLAVAFAPTNDESTLGTNFPALPHTIRVFYAGGLTSGNAGESWPDFNFAGQHQVGASFINGAVYGLGTVAHEVGHVLTNKDATVNTGHYRRPALPAGNRLHTNQNLMANLPSPPAGGVNVRKRLWDAPDADGINQYTEIRGSHYTRAF